MYIPSGTISKRDICINDDCTDTFPVGWVAIPIIVAIIVGLLVSTCVASRRRVRRGGQPIAGTAWIIRPMYVEPIPAPVAVPVYPPPGTGYYRPREMTEEFRGNPEVPTPPPVYAKGSY
jgi:hypothetical protein